MIAIAMLSQIMIQLQEEKEILISVLLINRCSQNIIIQLLYYQEIRLNNNNKSNNYNKRNQYKAMLKKKICRIINSRVLILNNHRIVERNFQLIRTFQLLKKIVNHQKHICHQLKINFIKLKVY